VEMALHGTHVGGLKRAVYLGHLAAVGGPAVVVGFVFHQAPPPVIYTLSLHDALPISFAKVIPDAITSARPSDRTRYTKPSASPCSDRARSHVEWEHQTLPARSTIG